MLTPRQRSLTHLFQSAKRASPEHLYCSLRLMSARYTRQIEKYIFTDANQRLKKEFNNAGSRKQDIYSHRLSD